MPLYLVTEWRYDTQPPPPGFVGIYDVRVIVKSQDDDARYYVICRYPAPYPVGDIVELSADDLSPVRPS